MPKVNYRSQFSYGFAGQAVKLRATVSIGASGAPTISSTSGMGIASMTRNGAGDYSILLTDAFQSLLDLSVVSNSGTSAPAAPNVNIRSNAVSTAAAPTLRIQMRDLTGAAADPANGEVLTISIELNRSSTGC